MKNCSNIKKYVCDYIDGTLSEEELEIVKNHLSQCETCKKEFEDTHMIAGICSKLVPVELPANFKETLFERISADQKQIGKENVKNIFSIFVKNNVVKAASIILVAGVLLYSSYFALFLDNNKNSKHRNTDSSEQTKMFSVSEAQTRQEQNVKEDEQMPGMSISSKDEHVDNTETRVAVFAKDKKDAEIFEQIIIAFINDNKLQFADNYEKNEFQDTDRVTGEKKEKIFGETQVYKFFAVNFSSKDEKLKFISQIREKIGEDRVNVAEDNESLTIIVSIEIK